MIGIRFVLNTWWSPSLEYRVFASTTSPIFSDENELEGGKCAFEDLTTVRNAIFWNVVLISATLIYWKSVIDFEA